jgi:hypothetical protein
MHNNPTGTNPCRIVEILDEELRIQWGTEIDYVGAVNEEVRI